MPVRVARVFEHREGGGHQKRVRAAAADGHVGSIIELARREHDAGNALGIRGVGAEEDIAGEVAADIQAAGQIFAGAQLVHGATAVERDVVGHGQNTAGAGGRDGGAEINVGAREVIARDDVGGAKGDGGPAFQKRPLSLPPLEPRLTNTIWAFAAVVSEVPMLTTHVTLFLPPASSVSVPVRSAATSKV